MVFEGWFILVIHESWSSPEARKSEWILLNGVHFGGPGQDGSVFR